MIYNIFIWAFVLNIVSCTSKNRIKIQVYNFFPTVDCNTCSFPETMDKLMAFDPKSVTIQNDSIVILYKSFGGLGFEKQVKYNLIKKELKLDSIDISGTIGVEIQDRYFLFNKDSLINIQTGERFYSRRFYKIIRKR